uniref:Kinesin motor domain-containing protein n=1 Tax=Cynoglossus semilaevis TaxID=244447 RepID=A0A3P8WFF5_CYNSE
MKSLCECRRQEGQQRVRKRPLTSAESRRGETDVTFLQFVAILSLFVFLDLKISYSQCLFSFLQHRFYFDQVFGEDSSNEEVYQSAVFPLVQGKATCFAYGQMGAGKTHTMLSSSTKMPGLYALAVRDIFKHQSTSQTLTLVYVSFFEIYCGQLYNLLDRRKRYYIRNLYRRIITCISVFPVCSMWFVDLAGSERASDTK